MRRDEYEERKQTLDEQLDAGIELLRAAHRQQVRALDLIWMTTAEEDGGVSVPGETPAAIPAAEAAPESMPEAAPAPRRRAWELYGEILDALEHVPEIFDRGHVCERLGFEPDRGSLYRAFQELVEEGILSVHAKGEGRHPTRYKKSGTNGQDADA
jgi:hypothetical protein